MRVLDVSAVAVATTTIVYKVYVGSQELCSKFISIAANCDHTEPITAQEQRATRFPFLAMFRLLSCFL